MCAQSLVYHERVPQNWLPGHLQIEMNLMLNEYNRLDKGNSELNEHRKGSTNDPTSSTSSWIPDPPERLTIKKTTRKNGDNDFGYCKQIEQLHQVAKSILIVLSSWKPL